MKKFIFPKSYVLLLASFSLMTAFNAAGETYLAEASSSAVGLDNSTNKLATATETLLLPAAWGDTNSVPTLTVVGQVVTPSEDESYDWNTGPLMPDEYLVNLAYGTTNFTARFTVAALAVAEWGTLDLDNVTSRTAKDSETLTLPASWGETNYTDIALVWTDELGDHEQALDATATSYAWNTLPLMPGAYNIKLSYGGKETTVASYTVSALGEGEALAGATIDNAYDEDPAGEGVRDIANHTNVFKLAWLGAESPSLTLDGEATGATADDEGNWEWSTNGLTYALYTFTNNVAGSNYVARFRVNSDKIAVMFHEDTNDVLVASNWNYLPDAADDASRKVLSDLLKTNGDNGLALWKSYVLGVSPDTTVGLKSNIAVTNLTGLGKVEVTVWPTEALNVSAGSQATVNYAIERADALEGTPNWTSVKNLVSAGDLRYVETNESTQVKRFYRTSLDVSPTAKSK